MDTTIYRLIEHYSICTLFYADEYNYLKTFLNILLSITSKFYMDNWVLSFVFEFNLIAVLSLVDVSMIPRTAASAERSQWQ